MGCSFDPGLALFTSSEEGKRALPVLAKPFGAGVGALLTFIGVVIRTLEGRQGLRRDGGAVILGSVRRGIAADGERRDGRDDEGGGKADQCDCLEHGLLLRSSAWTFR